MRVGRSANDLEKSREVIRDADQAQGESFRKQLPGSRLSRKSGVTCGGFYADGSGY